MAVVIIMENSRSAIFALYHVLCRFSSREEPLSIEKIRTLLKQEHSLSLTRTTLRSYRKALDDFGIRIAAVPGGRYLAGRLRKAKYICSATRSIPRISSLRRSQKR